MENRMKYLQQSNQRWCHGSLLIEKGQCLIEDEEGEIMLPESLQSPMIFIKDRNDWAKGELLGSTILHENGELHEIKGGELIQYTPMLAKGWVDFLMSVPENGFYHVIKQLEQLGFSVYDCVFSSFYPFHSVSFFQFSAEIQSLALHYYHQTAHGQIRFEWTTSSGHMSTSQFHVI
ncbi:DUF2777 family protein [Bacillus sp. 179-C3.3 HS]|uniref:DUF2777 family protein n=1 Tax=Bacillus sp. 179-C3.3 HS TaxID=3232162 RepID=UPI0039A1567C